jgi:hypothetical protein
MSGPDFGDVEVIALTMGGGGALVFVQPIDHVGDWVIHLTHDHLWKDDEGWRPFTLTHMPTGKRCGMFPAVAAARGAGVFLDALISNPPLGDFEAWLAESLPRRLRLAADLIEKFDAQGLSDSGLFGVSP